MWSPVSSIFKCYVHPVPYSLPNPGKGHHLGTMPPPLQRQLNLLIHLSRRVMQANCMSCLRQSNALERARFWKYFLASFTIVVPFGWPVMDDKQSPPHIMLSSTPSTTSTGLVKVAMGEAGARLTRVSSSPIMYCCFLLSE
jgi:hypothetical protein